MQHLHFLSGLPRSGSTLLANLLAQNPAFYTTATSGILEVLVPIRNGWADVAAFAAAPDRQEARKLNVMRGVVAGFYGDVKQPTVFDKSRGWLGYLEMAAAILGRRPKVLVTVRDVPEVICSVEQIFRANRATHQLPLERVDPVAWQTVAGRADVLMRPGSLIGGPWHLMRGALECGWLDSMLFIDFDRLCAEPDAQMNRIYRFLGETPFLHDFKNIEQVTVEDDTMYGWPADSLHRIRREITPPKRRADHILGGELVEQYRKYNTLWAELTE